MLAFEKKQTYDLQTQQPHDHQDGEKGFLNTAGFERAEDGLLWKKNGVYYGKEAASQQAWREQHGRWAP